MMASEMMSIHNVKSISPLSLAKNAEGRKGSVNGLQERWNHSGKGRFTRRLVPTIKDWLDRRHAEINYDIIIPIRV